MITGAAGITAAAFSVRNPSVFWAGILLVVLFAAAELYYIDIQEVVIDRNRDLDKLIDSLSRGPVKPEHNQYVFGLGKTFSKAPRRSLTEVLKWMRSRTFNSILYGGILVMMLLGLFFAPVVNR
jgi:hypothetical protein